MHAAVPRGSRFRSTGAVKGIGPAAVRRCIMHRYLSTTIFAQALTEHSALTGIASAVDRTSFEIQAWIASLDSRVFWIVGLIVVGWLTLRLFSRRY